MDTYHCKHVAKSKAFQPGDRIKLIKISESRGWITDHSKVGMTGIVVDYGPGTYDFHVFWSVADYEGQPMDDHGNRWQHFFVNADEIERIL